MNQSPDLSPVFAAAERVMGKTAPNPPVAAGAYDAQGSLLGVAAHQGAGLPHAERNLLDKARREGWIDKIHTLYTTLEPCHHHGRTPPCTHMIVAEKIPRVLYGVRDPNPEAAGGADFLKENGVDVEGDVGAEEACISLAPFLHKVKTGLPFVVVKSAHRTDGGMIPPPGAKTFTSQKDLTAAHILRRQSDAIITGSGTVLADHPLFTVRHVADHPGKKRHVVILDRRRRVPQDYLAALAGNGLVPHIADDFDAALRYLADQGCLQVLVEAGPTLLSTIESRGCWQKWVRFYEENPK